MVRLGNQADGGVVVLGALLAQCVGLFRVWVHEPAVNKVDADLSEEGELSTCGLGCGAEGGWGGEDWVEVEAL